MADINTGEVIQEMERGLRVFQAFEKGKEIALALASIEQRTGEMQQSFERRLALNGAAMDTARAQLDAVWAQAKQEAEQAGAAKADAQAQAVILQDKAKAEADAMVARATAEQTRIEGLINEASLRLLGLQQAVASLDDERITLETQVQAARDAKNELLRA